MKKEKWNDVEQMSVCEPQDKFSRDEQLLSGVCVWCVWEVYRGAGGVYGGTQVKLAVQIDVTRVSRELEHLEGERAGRSLSVVHHLHRVISGVRTAARKQEHTH